MATGGDAHLHLGDPAAALSAYRAAIAADPSPRELASMYAQAAWTAALVGDGVLEDEIERVFRPAGGSADHRDAGE